MLPVDHEGLTHLWLRKWASTHGHSIVLATDTLNEFFIFHDDERRGREAKRTMTTYKYIYIFLTWHKRSFTVSSYSHFSQCGWQLLPRASFFSLWMSQLIPCLCPLHCFHSHQQTSNLLHYINQSPLCSLFKPPRWEFQPWHSPTSCQIWLFWISFLDYFPSAFSLLSRRSRERCISRSQMHN